MVLTAYQHSMNSETKAPTQPFSRHRYVPLSSPSSIRILDLHPGTPGSEIGCSLREVSLADAVDYHALSYVWGEPIFPHRIHCDKGHLMVTKSLHSALQHYRLTRDVRHLWIDAICINQNDNAERSQQVLLMQRIYSKSKLMYTWLGEATAAHRKAFDFMSEILSLPTIRFSIAFMQRFDQAAIDSLTVLFRNPWFRRCWTYQELISCKDAEIACGSLHIALNGLRKFCLTLVKAGFRDNLRSQSARHAVGQFYNIDFHRKCSAERSEQSAILKLARYTRDRLASDPRDKIYSLASIAGDPIPLPYPPNYKINVAHLYRDFAAHTITTTKCLEILASCIYGSSSFDIPSWVPDWTQNEPLTVDLQGPTEPYNASKHLYTDNAIAVQDRLLCVQGVIADTIECVSQFSRPNEPPRTSGKHFMEFAVEAAKLETQTIDDARKTALQAGMSDSEIDKSDTWWQALVGGRLEDGTRIISNIKPSILKYISWNRKLACGRAEQVMASENDTADVAVQLGIMSANRRFCVTKERRFGWLPKAALKGDVVGVLTGSALPILLRPVAEGYEVVGPCYIHGLMDGEGVACEKYEVQRIRLV